MEGRHHVERDGSEHAAYAQEGCQRQTKSKVSDGN